MRNILIYILFLFGMLYADIYTGYFRQIETSFCMDECSQYALETESGEFINYIIDISNTDLSYYLNRYVTIDANNTYNCLMCSALILDSIQISNECDFPVSCFVDPCEVAEECQLNTPVECISNYCDGCYADFYNLEYNLVDCDLETINPCDDIGNVFFGWCDMYLGVAVVNGQCDYVSGCGWESNGIDYSGAFFTDFSECEQNCLNQIYLCDNIEYDYAQLHTGIYTSCEMNEDCISIWGDCGVGLGGCHYSVNESLYLDEDTDQLVDLWIEEECMEWACDCMPLPESFCNDEGLCDLEYCLSDNPAGCFSSGCDENYSCLDYEETGNCIPSSCYCDEFYGSWYCTEDCNGGTCYLNGDINYDGNIDIVDIVMTVNIILGLNEPHLLSDINLDGTTNVIDVILMITLILE